MVGKSISKYWHKRIGHSVLIILAIVLVSYGSWGLIRWFIAIYNPRPTIPNIVVEYSTDHPDETPPKDSCSAYEVAANQPRKIELPSSAISGCVQRVGIDQLRRIAVPLNIHVAGWFVKSSVPGEDGVSIITGHVQGYYQAAIFKHLSETRHGDTVRVQFGDMSWREFSVISISNYPIDDVVKEQFRQLSGVKKQLTIITCGGLDHASQTYNERVIVRAEMKT